MAHVIRFGVSLEKELLDHFDRRLKAKSYTNRSEAIRDLIREDLVDVESGLKKSEASQAEASCFS